MFVADSSQLLKQGDPVAQELVNSLQVLEVTAGAMSQDLIPLVWRHSHIKYSRTSSITTWRVAVFSGLLLSPYLQLMEQLPLLCICLQHPYTAVRHMAALCGCAQQDRYYGDHECVPGTCASLVGCYWWQHQAGGSHRSPGLYPLHVTNEIQALFLKKNAFISHRCSFIMLPKFLEIEQGVLPVWGQ